jgi:hypothetical protein
MIKSLKTTWTFGEGYELRMRANEIEVFSFGVGFKSDKQVEELEVYRVLWN